MKASKIIGMSAGAVLLGFTTGCVAMMTESIMEKHGYKKATRAQMMQPATPSFPLPQPRSALSAFPKEKIIGLWSGSSIMDTRISLLSLGYIGPTQTLMTHQKYWFFENGTYKSVTTVAGKETVTNGDWEYHDGVLTLSATGGDGKPVEFGFKVLRYSDSEMELRYADLTAYENLFKRAPNVKSVDCRYEKAGVFHSRITIANQNQESLTAHVQSPQIFTREGAE